MKDTISGTYIHIDLLLALGIWISPKYYSILLKISHELAIKQSNEEIAKLREENKQQENTINVVKESNDKLQ